MYLQYVVAHAMTGLQWDYHNFTDNTQQGLRPAIGVMGNAGLKGYWTLAGMCDESNPYAYSWSDFPETWSDQAFWRGGTFAQGEITTWLMLAVNDPSKFTNSQTIAFINGLGQDYVTTYSRFVVDWSGYDFDMNEPREARVALYHLARCFVMDVNAQTPAKYSSISTDLDNVNEIYKAFLAQGTTSNVYYAKWAESCDMMRDDLAAWDGVSAPEGTWGYVAGKDAFTGKDSPQDPDSPNAPSSPDVGGATGGTATEVANAQTAGITFITANSAFETLFIHTTAGRTVAAHRAGGGNVWLLSSNGGSISGTGAYSNGNYASGATLPLPEQTGVWLTDAIAYLTQYEGSWAYAYGADGRLDPINSGVTDCSAGIVSMARYIRPDSQMAYTGAYTGSMANVGFWLASGGPGNSFPYDLALPGDLVLMNWSYYNPEYDHVELYLGTQAQGNTTGSEMWNFGSVTYGNPCRSGNAQDRIALTHDWLLVRISWEEA